jgi:hypothetical protein
MTMLNIQPKPPEKPVTQQAKPAARKPNESGHISVQAHFKIFDPATKQVFVEGRA